LKTVSKAITAKATTSSRQVGVAKYKEKVKKQLQTKGNKQMLKPLPPNPVLDKAKWQV